MNEDDGPGDLGDQPHRPPLTPGDGRYDRFRRAADVPPEAMDAMRDAVRQGLENAGITPGSLPPELAAIIEAQAQQMAGAREMNGLSMDMQAAGLHECFIALTTPPGPDRFTPSEALYYMGKCSPGI